jgi:hypothetical protein
MFYRKEYEYLKKDCDVEEVGTYYVIEVEQLRHRVKLNN